MADQRSILVFEYLLADAAAWKTASASMKIEATTMLTALVEDIARLQTIRPVLLMSSVGADLLRSVVNIDAMAEILICDVAPTNWLDNPSRDPMLFDATFVIAPESNNVLVDLLQQLQCGIWATVVSLNVPWQMARTFTDKFRTFEWLASRDIRTPATTTLDNAVAEDLRQQETRSPAHCGDRSKLMPDLFDVVIKPRDGVGCDGILRLQMPREHFELLLQSDSDDEPWLLQQYIPGIACSVGFIGSGPDSPPSILLPALQDLQFRNGIPHYCGGQIPCEPDLSVILQNVAQKLALCLGGFSGYLGADIVVSHDESGGASAHVIEINPRLCTSYAGYRCIAETNLASLLLHETSDREIRWRKAVVRFDSAGNIHADASGHQKSAQPLDNPGIE